MRKLVLLVGLVALAGCDTTDSKEAMKMQAKPVNCVDAKQDIACHGVITKKYQEGGQNFVELDIWTENPDGRKTSPGTALVTLPSRNGG